jgi:hypothetical protein
MRDNLLYTHNWGGLEVLCVPWVRTKDHSTTSVIIDQAHTILGHFSAQKTTDYIHCWYWWPWIAQVEQFCTTCRICQASKSTTKRQVGLLHPLLIPNWPWQSIGMDFIGPFPMSHGYYYLWVVICRLTSMVHLIPVNTAAKASELVLIYTQ